MNARFLRHNSGKSLCILIVALSFVHHAGSICAIANLGNIFSWLLWLSIIFCLILSIYKFVGWLLVSHLSQSIAVNFKLFK